MNIYTRSSLSGGRWRGTIEHYERARTFGRQYPWEEEIEDPEYAADQVLAALSEQEELDPEAERVLHAALVASAELTTSKVAR